MDRNHLTHAAAVLTAAAASLLAPPAQAQSFADVAQDLGVDHTHFDGFDTANMGGGLAWFDYDGDGAEDLFVGSSDGLHRLYRNEGAQFVETTTGSGLSRPGTENMGVIAADFDQDGRCDLYLSNRGPNTLLRNRGKGRFTDVAARLGAAGDRWSTSASFADFDLDGDLDLYVGNYLDVVQFPWHLGSPNDLYLNRSERGEVAFEEVAARMGVDGRGEYGLAPESPWLHLYPPAPTGEPTASCTLSVCTLDYDEDGDPDILVGNDFGAWVIPDQLFRNELANGDLTFSDATVETNFDERPLYNMGINPCDFDHDGDWDLYLSNLGDNVFLRNDDGVFHDAVYELGPVSGKDDEGDEVVSWGSVWADFDNDGFEDLFVGNGYVPAAFFLPNAEKQMNDLWMNTGEDFVQVSHRRSGVADAPGITRGVASSDYDADGLVDFAVQNTGGLALSQPGFTRIYRNTGRLEGRADHHWLQLTLRGVESNLEGIGARVELHVGSEVWKRQVLADPIYLSSSSRVVHFGIGTREGIDRVVIDWPSGIRQVLRGLEVDRRHVVRESPTELDPTPSVPVPAGR